MAREYNLRSGCDTRRGRWSADIRPNSLRLLAPPARPLSPSQGRAPRPATLRCERSQIAVCARSETVRDASVVPRNGENAAIVAYLIGPGTPRHRRRPLRGLFETGRYIAHGTRTFRYPLDHDRDYLCGETSAF